MVTNTKSDGELLVNWIKKLEAARDRLNATITELVEELGDMTLRQTEGNKRRAPDAEARKMSINEAGFLVGDRVRKRNVLGPTKVGTVRKVTPCFLYVIIDGVANSGEHQKHNSYWKLVSQQRS
jgi:hypothetical protein